MIQSCELVVSILPLLIIYYGNFNEKEKWIVLGLIGISGFCLGGIYDVYSNH